MKDIFDFIREFNGQTLCGMAILLWIFLKQLKKEINLEISRIEGDIDIHRQDLTEQRNRSDKIYNSIRNDLSIQAKRSDHLYKMFIDLLKEKHEGK